MPRDLVRLTRAKMQGLVLFKKGEVTGVIGPDEVGQAVAGLRPGDMLDFITLPDKRVVLVISDTPVEDPNMLVEGGQFLPLDQVSVETASWELPLSLPAILARSLGDRDDAWTVLEELAGRYLELGAWSDQTKPWKDGLVAAIVRANWKHWKEEGLVEGESSWGWIRGRYHISNGGPSWESVKGKFEGYMRAADVFLRNYHERGWIAELTYNKILEVPISKAIRCCGSIREELFSHFSLGPGLQAALFDTTITNTTMNHLIAHARGQRLDFPVQRVDEETGEVEYVIPATGEKVDESKLDEYFPEEVEAIDASRPTGTFWVFDHDRLAFEYIEDGIRHPGLTAQADNPIVKRFIEEVIRACKVRADYA